MSKKDILSLVLAGGKGERLTPLTLQRSKPSVPFGGKYRIIDFALSNLVNSGIYSIYVLVQYKSQSLIEHIRTGWPKQGVLPEHFITPVPPQMRRDQLKEWYRGTADSVYQNINLIYDFKPKIIAIFGGDHIYRMDIQQMIDFHRAQKAHATISVIPVKAHEARGFGIIKTGVKGKIKDFKEKPRMRGKQKVRASMGNYIFNADVLAQTLEVLSKKTNTHDFGKDILPYLVAKKAKVFAYDFSMNRIPGRKKHEESYYWRDVGTIASYFKANMDLLGKRPKLVLDNDQWPIRASSLNKPSAYIDQCDIRNSIVSGGSRMVGARVRNSIVGRGVTIQEGSSVEDSIIMDFTTIGRGCRLKRAIVDRFNFVQQKSIIGYNRKNDSARYVIDSSGIVVLQRRPHQAFYW